MRSLALVLLLLLLACTTRRTVEVANLTGAPVSLRLLERHPQYADYSGDTLTVPSGGRREIWYDADFENTLIVTDPAGKELRRLRLAAGDQPPIAISGAQRRDR